MWIYIGNYSYICQLCDKGFFGFYKLKKYLKLVYWDVYFVDGVCNVLEYQFFIMVFLNFGRVFILRCGDYVMFMLCGNVVQFLFYEEIVFFLLEDYLVDVDDDVFDELGFEIGDELILEDE